MTVKGDDARRPHSWGGLLQIALFLCLIAMAGTIQVVLQSSVGHAEDARSESRELTALISVEAAVAEISQTSAIGQFRTSSALDGGVITPSVRPAQQGGSTEFDELWTRLDALAALSEDDIAVEQIVNHAQVYGEAVNSLVAARGFGAPEVVLHFRDVAAAAEFDLTSSLLDFKAEQAMELELASEASARADEWLQRLVPAVAALALLVLGSLLWLQRRRRVTDVTRVEQQSRQKDQFVASISHEIRTPLTSVIGFLEVLRSGVSSDPTERAELIEIASREAGDLANLVEDLLVLAKLDVGSLSSVAVRVTLSAQIAQVLESLAEDSIEIVGSGPPALGDPVRIRQVLRNLITNARRYGGPNVRIELDCREALAFVRVIDDGAGVPEGDEDRIFEPYERAHSQTGVAGSVGLGLAVSRRLVELMNGSLVYRRENECTVFELAFPIHMGTAADRLAAEVARAS